MADPVEPIGAEKWLGLHYQLDPKDMPAGMSPDLLNCFSHVDGMLSPRPGVKFVSSAFNGDIRGVMPFALPDGFLTGGDGRAWIVAYEDGGTVTLSVETALWQGFDASATAIPRVSCCGGAALFNLSWDLAGTSGVLLLALAGPDGTFTMTDTEADGAAYSTTIGCLLFTYSGASRGTRGILTITGIGKPGAYTGLLTKTGTISDSGGLTTVRSIRYTSVTEGYSNTLLAFNSSVAGWRVANLNFTFAEP